MDTESETESESSGEEVPSESALWAFLQKSGAELASNWGKVIAIFRSVSDHLSILENAIEWVGIISLVVILMLMGYAKVKHICIVEHSELLDCDKALIVLPCFTVLVLILYGATLISGVRDWVRNRLRNIPGWVYTGVIITVPTFCILGSNAFSYWGIKSFMCLAIVELFVVAFWCWEYNLGQRHFLALSSCCLSIAISMTFAILNTPTLTWLKRGGLIGIIIIVTITFVYFTLPQPNLHITLNLDNPPNQQTVLLRPHTNQGYGTFQLTSCDSNITLDGLYEFAAINIEPNQPHQGRRYEILPARQGN